MHYFRFRGKKINSFNYQYVDFIRQGVQITLRPIVHFINRRLHEKLGDDWIKKTCYIYSNSSSDKGRLLRVKNGRIQWDLYNILTFISHNQKKQPIDDEQFINFRSFLFDDLRDDIFDHCKALRSLRNIISHPTYDGVEEFGYDLNTYDVEAYLNQMKFLIHNFSNDDIELERMENLLSKFVKSKKDIKIVKVSERRLDTWKEWMKEIYHDYDNELILCSTVNKFIYYEEKSLKTIEGAETFFELTFDNNINKRKMVVYEDNKDFIEYLLNEFLGKETVTLMWTHGVFDASDKRIGDPQTTCCFIMEFENSSGLVYSSHAGYKRHKMKERYNEIKAKKNLN